MEGTGFSQETDLNKEKLWDGVFKLRGVEKDGTKITYPVKLLE